MDNIEIITLSGGYKTEAYTNHRCPVCGADMHEEVCCRKERANICMVHCIGCQYYLRFEQKCLYRKNLRNTPEARAKIAQKSLN